MKRVYGFTSILYEGLSLGTITKGLLIGDYSIGNNGGILRIYVSFDGGTNWVKFVDSGDTKSAYDTGHGRQEL